MPIFEGIFDIVLIVFLPKLSVVSLFSKKKKKKLCVFVSVVLLSSLKLPPDFGLNMLF